MSVLQYAMQGVVTIAMLEPRSREWQTHPCNASYPEDYLCLIPSGALDNRQVLITTLVYGNITSITMHDALLRPGDLSPGASPYTRQLS